MIESVEQVATNELQSVKVEPERQGLLTFLLVWAGQTVSAIGSELTGFGLAVWVYQHTGSATKFSLIAISTVTPGVLLAPVLGVIVDRYSRQRLMIVSNVISGVSTLILAFLYLLGNLQVWHICALMVVIAISSNLLGPSYTASISTLVPTRFLGRATGLVQFGQSAADMLGPLMAGFLLLTIHIHGVLLIDFATYLFGIFTLVIVRFPAIPRNSSAGGKVAFLNEISMGVRYIVARTGLLALVSFFALTNFILGMENILKLPLVLSFAGASFYGVIISVGGTGMLLGSLTMSLWGGPKRRVYGVYLYGAALGLGLSLESLRPNAWLIAIATFLITFVAPMANGTAIPILQTKTALALQGRVFSAVRFITGLAVPLSYILAGRLNDKIFEPFMTRNHTLRMTVGRLIGVGPGRGTALLLLVLGMFALLATIIAVRYRRLSRVEIEVPDAISATPNVA